MLIKPFHIYSNNTFIENLHQLKSTPDLFFNFGFATVVEWCKGENFLLKVFDILQQENISISSHILNKSVGFYNLPLQTLQNLSWAKGRLLYNRRIVLFRENFIKKTESEVIFIAGGALYKGKLHPYYNCVINYGKLTNFATDNFNLLKLASKLPMNEKSNFDNTINTLGAGHFMFLIGLNYILIYFAVHVCPNTKKLRVIQVTLTFSKDKKLIHRTISGPKCTCINFLQQDITKEINNNFFVDHRINFAF